MGEIVMGKDKHVGDSTLVTELDDSTLVFGILDYAQNPNKKELYKNITVIRTDAPTYCSSCKQQNGPGVQVTILENGIFIYACPKCDQFVWCKAKK